VSSAILQKPQAPRRAGPHRQRVFRKAGFAISGIYAALAVFMLYGEALSDPGGLKGLGVVLLPTLAFATVARVDHLHPRLGLALLAGLSACTIAFHASIGLGLLSRESELGPHVGYGVVLLALLPVPVFILATLHARTRTGEAGALVVIVGCILAATRPGVALLLVGPPMIAGALVAASALAAKDRGSG